jgi:type VI secretion system secreted protein Hcp
MAIDGYMYFKYYNSTEYLKSESQVLIKPAGVPDPMFDDGNFGFKAAYNAQQGEDKHLFEIEDFSFDIEQTLNIGSQSTGAGAGRVTFNPFSITRKIDRSSPNLYEMACSGTPYETVGLALRKGGGGTSSGIIFLVFLFKLVAVKTISWSYDDESPKETVTFEYGGLQVHYGQQKSGGTIGKVHSGGWNRVKNVSDREKTPIA